MRRLDSHSASDHQKPMRESQTVPCDAPAFRVVSSGNSGHAAWYCARIRHRFLMIRRTVAIYATHSPRSDIQNLAFVHFEHILITLINLINVLIKVIKSM